MFGFAANGLSGQKLEVRVGNQHSNTGLAAGHFANDLCDVILVRGHVSLQIDCPSPLVGRYSSIGVDGAPGN